MRVSNLNQIKDNYWCNDCKWTIIDDKGDIDAMNNYWYMLQKGKGVKANIEEALKYYKMAADKGYSDSLYN